MRFAGTDSMQSQDLCKLQPNILCSWKLRTFPTMSNKSYNYNGTVECWHQYLKSGPVRPLFIYFRHFKSVDNKQVNNCAFQHVYFSFLFIFVLFSFQYQLQLSTINWKSVEGVHGIRNPGQQDSRRRWNHGAMVATQALQHVGIGTNFIQDKIWAKYFGQPKSFEMYYCLLASRKSSRSGSRPKMSI